MNALRLTATVLAFIVAVGGGLAALGNLPSAALGQRPVPAYAWTNLLFGVVMPVSVVLAGAVALLLLVRIDRRLDQLQPRSDA